MDLNQKMLKIAMALALGSVSLAGSSGCVTVRGYDEVSIGGRKRYESWSGFKTTLPLGSGVVETSAGGAYSRTSTPLVYPVPVYNGGYHGGYHGYGGYYGGYGYSRYHPLPRYSSYRRSHGYGHGHHHGSRWYGTSRRFRF